jgi:hypothetical protein
VSAVTDLHVQDRVTIWRGHEGNLRLNAAEWWAGSGQAREMLDCLQEQKRRGL